MMKLAVVAALCLALPFAAAARDGNGYSVKYDGGTLSDLKTGNEVKLSLSGDVKTITKGRDEVTSIPATAVTEISYGQDVHRRVGTAVGVAMVSFGIGALTALSKSKKHFVGLTWANGDAKGGFAMQCDKNDYRGILAGLEGLTGKKAVDSDAFNVKN
jgi:hypothetical protein